MSSHYILYGTDHSYYTGKIRPYLRYKGIPFKEKLSTLLVYQRFIIPRTGVRFIPVLHTPDNLVVQDTTEIIDFLEQRFPDRPVYPESPKQKLVALLFEIYGDEWFTLPAMHYRWSYLSQQHDYVMEAFGDVAGPWLPAPLKRFAGKKLSRPFKGALKPLGISANTAPAIEAWYRQFLLWFNSHLETHDYLLGSRPCVGDFSLAGPMYAHMWRDPVPKKMLQEQAPRVIDWLERINRPSQNAGAFLEDDAIPDTLLPMLSHLFSDYWPLLEDTAIQLASWLQQNPHKAAISRAIGEHTLTIGNASEKRLIFPYAQWMMQRPLTYYQNLPQADKKAVDEWLAESLGPASVKAMNFRIPRPVLRKHNKLVAA